MALRGFPSGHIVIQERDLPFRATAFFADTGILGVLLCLDVRLL